MSFINIIGTLFDNSVNHIVALANQLLDQRLNKNQQDINEDIYNKLDNSYTKEESDQKYLTEHQSLTNYATKTFVDEKISEVVGAAPETLDTLKEIADALNDNATMSDIAEAISTKANSEDVYTKVESDNKYQPVGNYLTQHQDISGKANIGDSYTKEESDNRYNQISQSQIKHIFLTQEQYDSLETYQNNTLYIILESIDEEEIGFAFGDKLPIRFGWVFGGEFPVMLS